MKDPAFLFYPGDWVGGTLLLNRAQKGAYIDLLIAQFNNGPLMLEDIKIILGADFGHWQKLENKFSFMNGRYSNQRLEIEKNKRSEYTASRRSNRMQHMSNHMSEHMEYRDINENRIELPDWLNKKAWNAWEQHRKEKGKKLTPTSLRLQLKLLEENKETHTQIIKNSITNGWTGLFPLREGQKKPNKYIEPNLDKETNDRRNELLKQFKV